MQELLHALHERPNDRELLAELYRRNYGLLVCIARRYADVLSHRGDVDFEDLTQTGYFGLVAASRTYAEGCGKTWAGWAGWYIETYVLRALGMKSGVLPPLAASLDAVNDETGLCLADMLEDDSLPSHDARLIRQDLRQAIETLPEIARRHLIGGERLGVLARETGKPRREIERITRCAIRQLREMLELDDRTMFYRHKSVKAFNSSWSSDTEDTALWRIEKTSSLLHQRNNL